MPSRAARPAWCRSSRSAARRSPTRSCRADELDRARADASRSSSSSARSCTLVQITETVPPEELFRDYLYFSSFSDTMLRHARELTRPADRRRVGSAPTSLVVEVGEQRRLPAAVLRRSGRSACSASSRPGTSRRSPTSAAVPTLTEFFGVALAERLVAEGTARRRHPRQQRARPRARPERLRRGHRAVSSPRTGVAVIEVPYVRGHDRPLRVRHDLSRAPLLLLAHGARLCSSSGTASPLQTSSGCRSTAARCGCS